MFAFQGSVICLGFREWSVHYSPVMNLDSCIRPHSQHVFIEDMNLNLSLVDKSDIFHHRDCVFVCQEVESTESQNNIKSLVSLHSVMPSVGGDF